MKKMNFISGLPRSGTTLLSSILNQNPEFSASISGPLLLLAEGIIERTQSFREYRISCPPQRRKDLLLNLVDTFYKNSNPVAFDTNRGWTYSMPLLADLYPEAKVICCIRSIPWIIDSFETLFAKNPYDSRIIFPPEARGSVYARAEYLTSPNGQIGYGYNGLKEALFGPFKKNMLVVEYEQFVRNPQAMLKKIYAFIGEPWFEHDLDDVEASYDEFDAETNITGLHRVRKKVDFQERRTILPPDVFGTYEKMDFWKYLS